jgi:hypothetical protein
MSTRRRTAARFVLKDALLAGAVAGISSGAPSTIIALWKGEDVLEPSLAAGTLLLSGEHRRGQLLAAAAVVHGTLSFGWALLLSAVLPQRDTFRWSVLAGLAIATLDLAVVGQRFERIRTLPMPPQVADHMAYAMTVGAVLTARRRGRECGQR